MGNIKFFKKSQKNSVDYSRYSSNENITFSSIGQIFWRYGDVKFARFTASTRLLFRASRPGYEKTTISIEFKYHSTQKASYRIKWILIHIFRGHVLELIATGIFYWFLNIYKILRILREQKIVKFQKPKITPGTWFQT